MVRSEFTAQQVQPGIACLLLGLLLTLLAVTSPAAATEALASVSRATIVEGDAFTLRVRARPGDHELDLAPLLRDFEILDQQHSTNHPGLQEELGHSFTEWEITLRARNIGDLTIPALQVGEARTRPIDIRVLQITPEHRAIRERNVVLEVEPSRTDPYVGESIVVTLTLYYNVNISGSFADIAPVDAEWTALGEALEGSTRREDGRDYNYTRFHYLYTPMSPGDRTLPAFEFSGDYRAHSLAPRQRLQDVRSDPISLAVQPIPEAYPSDHPWLPAHDLTLTQYWQGNTSAPEVGDQITRHTTLTAIGPDAARLPRPQPEANLPSGVRHYEGPVRSDTQRQTRQRTSERHDESAYLLSAAGELTLPGLRVPWWDLEADALRWAEVPGQTLTVATGPLVPTPDLEPDPGETAVPDIVETPDTDARVNWRTGLLLVLGALVLGVLLLSRRGRGLAQRSIALPGRWLLRGLSALTRPLTGLWRRSRRSSAERTKARPQRNAHEQRQAETGKPGKAPEWTRRGRELATEHEWKALLQLLAENLADSGWPNIGRAAEHWQRPELPDLARDTQAMLYGQPEQQPDPDSLARRWDTCLRQWPSVAPRPIGPERPRGLYPD